MRPKGRTLSVMMVSDEQARRILAALCDVGGTDLTEGIVAESCTVAVPSDDGASDPADVSRFVEALLAQPSFRPERIEEARARLADGRQPSPVEIAEVVLRRLVRDRHGSVPEPVTEASPPE